MCVCKTVCRKRQLFGWLSARVPHGITQALGVIKPLNVLDEMKHTIASPARRERASRGSRSGTRADMPLASGRETGSQ